MAAVTIYTTSSCVFCLRAKEYLRSKGVLTRRWT
jgi:glutaredoxin